MRISSLDRRSLRLAVASAMLLSNIAPTLLLPVGALAAPTSPAAAAAAFPLIDRVPASAVVYAGFAGTATGQFKSSKLAKVTGNPKFNEVFDKLIPETVTAFGEPKASESVTQVLTELRRFTAYPMGLYVLMPRQAGMEPTVVGMIDGGAEVDALAAQIAADIQKAGGQGEELNLAKDGTILSISSEKGFTGAKLSDTDSILANPRFKDAAQIANGESFVTVFADFDPLLALASNNPQVQAGLEAAGVTGLKAAFLMGRFDASGEYVTDALLSAPDPRAGVIGVLLKPRTGPDTLLSRVPADAVSFRTTQLDLAGIVDEAIKTAITVEPRIDAQLPTIWNAATAATNVRIREDFLASLGTDWVSYEPASAPGKLVAINRANDAAKICQSLTLFTRFAQRMVLMAGAKNPQMPTVELATSTVADTKITTISFTRPPNPLGIEMGAVAISFAAKDGLFFVGTDTTALAAAFTAPAQDATTIPAYKALLARLNAPTASDTTYSDLPKTAAQMRSGLTEVLALVRTLPQAQPYLEKIPAEKIFDNLLDAAIPQLTPAAEVRWSDAAGYHTRTISPYPAAEIVGGSVNGLTVVGGSALGVSILLPSLNRARETANRVKSGSNLRQIGQAMQLYANENKGRFPDTLGPLLITQDISIECFTTPRSSTEIPARIRNGTPQQMAIWIDTQSDFVYLAKGLTSSVSPEVVVAHERTTLGLSDGINVLFGDGHVEFIMTKDLPKVMETSQAAGGK